MGFRLQLWLSLENHRLATTSEKLVVSTKKQARAANLEGSQYPGKFVSSCCTGLRAKQLIL